MYEELKRAIEEQLGETVEEAVLNGKNVFEIGSGDVKMILHLDAIEDVPIERIIENIKFRRELIYDGAFDSMRQNLLDFDYVKGRLILCVASKDSEIMKRAVTKEFLGMSLYVRVDFEKFSFPINNELLETWEVSIDEVIEVARANMKYHIIDLGLALGDEVDKMLLITTENHWYGAGAIYDSDILKEVSEKLGDKFLIIPSSVHEILVARDVDNRDELAELIGIVNNKHLNEDERLSDSLYMYEDGEVKVAV